MSDPTAVLFEWLKIASGWLAMALVGLLLWFGRRQIERLDMANKRLDELESMIKERVTRDEFERQLNRVELKLDASLIEQRQDFGKAHARLDDIYKMLANEPRGPFR